MRLPLAIRFLLLAAATILPSSCKRQAAKNLQLPSAVAPSPAPAYSPAAAEVTASSGPVRITFRLLNNKIRRGEPIEVQVILTNIGRDRIFMTDQSFLGPAKRLEDRGDLKEPPFGLSVEVTDLRGRRVRVGIPLQPDATAFLSPKPATPEEAEDLAEAGKKIKEWKAEGVSDTQITLNLFQLSQEKAKARARPPKSRWLKLGESIALPAWRAPEDARGPGPIPEGFTDLPYYAFPRPGKYKILLRCLYAPTTWLRREVPDLEQRPEDVDIITPAVEFEVLP